MSIIDVCIHITTHIVKNDLSMNFNQEYVNMLAIIILMLCYITGVLIRSSMVR
jgi:hypothetical protein